MRVWIWSWAAAQQLPTTPHFTPNHLHVSRELYFLLLRSLCVQVLGVTHVDGLFLNTSNVPHPVFKRPLIGWCVLSLFYHSVNSLLKK